MALTRLLVANRGEIAVRILRAARGLGLRTVAVHSEDDKRSLHTRLADDAWALRGTGPRAYLDLEQIVAAALESGCDAIHPGYGFLAESAELARRARAVGLEFVGPDVETLALFANKARARAVAEELGVATVSGISRAVAADEAREFFRSLPAGEAMVVKAVAGGGGRGMRVVTDLEEIEAAVARCRSEAEAAFGSADVYVERLVRGARHIEVQIVGDRAGSIAHLGERECTLQRRHQKLVEIAPSPSLDAATRARICEDAMRLAESVRYANLGTFEFLVDGSGEHSFIEANARLQVEHTVTEEVFGVDLVQAQLRLAAGATLDELDLGRATPIGYALEARVNLERIAADGSVTPTVGRVSVFEPPGGPGVRVDSFAYAGYLTVPAFDSLLAKLVVHSRSDAFVDVVDKAHRALSEFRIRGVSTNVNFLLNLLAHVDVRADRVDTRWIEEHAAELTDGSRPAHRPLYFDEPAGSNSTVGARVDSDDPLAVLAHGKKQAELAFEGDPDAPSGTLAVRAPLLGTVVGIDVVEGDLVRAGSPLVVIEAMKMEHVVQAPAGGGVRGVAIAVGDTVTEGQALVFLEEAEVEGDEQRAGDDADLDRIRPDLAETIERHALGLDARRPEAVERRHGRGQRTARENVEDLCDAGSFAEYGALTVAAQRSRRELEDLIRRTPADGLVCGIGRVNGELFGDRARCVVMSYDYTVLAGTQGFVNHRKKDRMFAIAEKDELPVVIFTEGGGGRPGDTDAPQVAGLDCKAFELFARLSGRVPLVGINSGYCFAGNAALLGCCDVIIAAEGSSIGMGGPAMIEGGGLGVFRPDEVGPMRVQVTNGVVDVAVADEVAAVAVAKRYLAYFQGRLAGHEHADQRLLRNVIPENRLRMYDVRRVVDLLADIGSVLELRRGFAPGMVTSLARIEGRPLGIVANNPAHLAGAIDPPGADKAARFMQLCDAHGLPILFLCDTPGIMVGPAIEKHANVRHAARMFVIGASLSVPFFTIVLRKGYGLGAQAMAGGSFHAPVFTVAWPTGEFGGMGLEGAVKLGFRNELAAVEDPAERKRMFEAMVARAYEVGKSLNMASHFEIDGVIDPIDSRRWILTALESTEGRTGPRRRRPCIDTW